MGKVVNSSNSQGFHQVRGPKQKVLINGPKDVAHENSYATLEHALISFMALIALKDRDNILEELGFRSNNVVVHEI